MRILAPTVIRPRLAGVAFALAIVLAGCSETTPLQEVRTGGSGSSPGSSNGQAGTDGPGDGPIGSDGSTGTGGSPVGSGGQTGGAEPGQPGSVEPSPPSADGGHPPAGSTHPPAGDVRPPMTMPPGDPRHPHPWGDHTLGADGRTLTFTYYAGVEPCSVFDSIVAEEGADRVKVTIYEHSGPEGVACIMLAQEKSASVTLAAPLGARALVDGAVSA